MNKIDPLVLTIIAALTGGVLTLSGTVLVTVLTNRANSAKSLLDKAVELGLEQYKSHLTHVKGKIYPPESFVIYHYVVLSGLAGKTINKEKVLAVISSAHCLQDELTERIEEYSNSNLKKV